MLPPLPHSEHVAVVVTVPIERTFVPSNHGFTLSRDNEFMFLMLGETVLQMVIATVDDHIEPNGNDVWDTLLTGVTSTAVFGFALAMCMLFSFRQMVDGQLSSYTKTNKQVQEEEEDEEAIAQSIIKERQSPVERLPNGTTNNWQLIAAVTPNGETITSTDENAMTVEDAQRIVLRGRMFNVLGGFLWQTKAVCVMLVGVAVKLAMYAPMAPADKFFALSQVGLHSCIAVVLGKRVRHCIALLALIVLPSPKPLLVYLLPLRLTAARIGRARVSHFLHSVLSRGVH